MSPKSSRPGASTSTSFPVSDPLESGQRLQKVLAAAGIASRRECEERIREGRVEVDRVTVTELGTRVDPLKQEIRVDGIPLSQPHHAYFMVHKPPGVVSTNRDPDGRTRVIDLVPGETRVFTVGRLDRSSEGLILVTNDGDLANLLTHPRYGIPKTYRASVLGFPTPETLQQLRKGVHLAEGMARVAELRTRGRHARGAELEIVLTEGRNREIRRILARVGHKVLHLRRIALGPLRLGSLAAGETRRLTGAEIQQLRDCIRSQLKRAGAGPGQAAPGVVERRPTDGRHRSEPSPPRRVPSAPPMASKFSDTKSRRPQKTREGQQQALPRSATGRPRIGAVLEYDRPPSTGAEQPAHEPTPQAAPRSMATSRSQAASRPRSKARPRSQTRPTPKPRSKPRSKPKPKPKPKKSPGKSKRH